MVDPHIRFRERALAWLGLALVLLGAYALRLHRLDAVPLRGDEAFAAVHWTKTPFSADWMFLVEYEPNPGAMIFYWAWAGFAGISEFALRMLPLLGGVLGVAMGAALTHRLTQSWRLAALVAVLWALNPFFVWHAQDARQYSLLTVLTPLNIYLLLRAIKSDERRLWLAYVFFQTLTLYIYSIEVFWVAAQGMYVLSLRRRDVARRVALAWAAMGALLIPLFVQMYYVTVLREYTGTASGADLGQMFAHVVPTLLFGEMRIAVIAGLLMALSIIAGVSLYGGRARALLLAWIIVPALLFYAASTRTPLFNPRYIIALTPALLIGTVITVDGLARRWHQRAGLYAAALVTVLSVISLAEIRAYFYDDPPKARDWRGMTAYLEARSGGDTALISDSADTALEYYYGVMGRVYFIPDGDDFPEDDLRALINENTTLFLLSGARTGPAGQFLQTHAQHIPGDTYPDLIQYRAWDVNPAEIAAPLDAEFGGVARLRGYTLLGRTTLLLYWEALAITDEEHSVLLHLEQTPGQPPLVLDHGVAGAQISTRTWAPGTLYRDAVALPVEMPPGVYTLLVGIYPTAGGESLTGPDGADRYTAGTLLIGE